MGKTYEELMAELSPERRARVKIRAAELTAEDKSLRDLREAQKLTQQSMAKMLGVKQHSISRLEQRSDLLLSTLRDYIGKMGGELELTARFPDRDPVKIKGFSDIAYTAKGSALAKKTRRTVMPTRSTQHSKTPALRRKTKSHQRRSVLAS